MTGRIAAACLILATSLPVLAQSEERGAVLFDLCAQCHAADGSGNQLFLAPSIAGLDEWYVAGQLQKFRSGARGTHPDDVGGMRMRPMSLTLMSDEDVAIVAAFVSGLDATEPTPVIEGGDPVRGESLYVTCVACHGAQGEGNEALSGPPLRNMSDWYLFEQINNFKSGVRGSDPRDATGIMMRPMAMTLVSDQDVSDVVAYITTLSK